MRRRSQRGFTLLEITIVACIALILSAIAIPKFLQAKQNAYEASAAGFMHTTQVEQIARRTTTGSYASSFSQLPDHGGVLVDNALASGGSGGGSSGGSGGASGGSSSGTGATSTLIRESYVFTLRKLNEEEWTMTATPLADRYNGYYFYTDQSGVIRSAKGPSSGPLENTHVQ